MTGPQPRQAPPFGFRQPAGGRQEVRGFGPPVEPLPPCAGRIKVAFLTPTLLMGGAERWLISLARCCDRRRIEWTGTALTEGAPAHPDLCREMSAYMPVYAGPRAGPPGFSPHVTPCPSARVALDAALRDADILVTWGVQDLAALVAGHRLPVVYVSHGCGEWSHWTVKSSESGATHFVAVSEAALAPFSPHVRAAAAVIHNGIDVERCTPTVPRQRVRAAWGFDDHDVLIGYVGRYSAEKNPVAAARAAAHLGGDSYALYAGSGWMEADLQTHAGAAAGSRARFVPMDRQVGNVLRAIDVFLLASPSEGFALAMAEAWYCGVPVVATRVGAVPELERRYGPLVSPLPIDASPEELAQAVRVALQPEFRKEVVPRAREVVCRYHTAGAMAARWTDYLCSIRYASRAPSA